MNFKNYTIVFEKAAFSVYKDTVQLFSVPVVSAVDRYEDIRMRPTGSAILESGVVRDDEEHTERLHHTVREENGTVIAEYQSSSKLWAEKRYRITASEHGFAYEVTVKGSGTVHQIRYFSSGAEKNYEFAGYLLPHAGQFKESECLRNVFENSQLSFDYYAPCPFVYPFYTEGMDGWFGIGLFAQKGEHNFDRFVYERGFSFTLPLDDRLTITGEKTLPGIWGGYGADAMAVLRAYAAWYYANGIAVQHEEYTRMPKWWREPIFCGWGEQQKMGRVQGRYATDYATQENYEWMLAHLKDNGIEPGIVIIDAKWQKHFGVLEVDREKWPDLRGFTDRMHAKGKHVLLWIKSWDAEGLPRNECIDLLCNPIAADPTNPQFIERTRKNIHALLSDEPECFGCDGFKIDFINCTPKGELLHPFDGNCYGVELIRAWLELVYTAAKDTKRDALINASCAHPYVADVCDQIRLHDYQGALRSSVEVMTFRKRIAEAIYGKISIDTDSGGTGSHRDFLRYMEAQPSIGVPDLYYVTSSFRTPMDEGDYAAIRTAWARYRKENGL